MPVQKQRLDVQMDVEAGDWPPEAILEDLARSTLEHAADFLESHDDQPFLDQPVEVSLVFTDDASMRRINAQWRSQDKPTNVLSFPAFPIAPGDRPGPMLGDIILAFETLEREAQDMAKTFDAHLKHLLVHGLLHLLGHDHMNDEDAAIMEGLETRILAGLGVSDPYGQNGPE